MRQIFLDTETTGLSPESGDRIIEIGCVEMVNRRLTGRHLHFYLNPERRNDEDAVKIHGLTDEFLADKPLFARVVDELLEFVARRRDHHPQRELRRRLPQRGTAPLRPRRVQHARRARHRHAADGARRVPRQVELARRAVQAPRGRQHQPHAARRAARRRPAGRGLHPHDARPGLAGDRRRTTAATAGRARARSTSRASSCSCSRPTTTNARRTSAAGRDRQGERRQDGLAAAAARAVA